ncbi:HpcH/HpaI aldolase/citrate lyase family protein [Erythrobacter sp. W53]|uniref:HpcH/HpaI aldolase/citrate lyase family protein n=1 Tax=Erythrobacter sp. W53 TaxID=3425947 RepID=UPI003D76A2B1
MTVITSPKMRSWLFAPGDSARKMEKAAGGSADIVLLDLEDAVAIEQKPEARRMVAEFLTANASERARLWVRINPLDGDFTKADLEAIMPAKPGGIMLPKAEGGHDMETLDAMLTPLEQAHGIEPGSTPVAVLVTETAAAMFTTGTYKGTPRLAAMTWGAEDLADSIGAMGNTAEDGSYRPTFELARSLCLLGAASAGVPALETIMADFRDLDGLKTRAEMVRRDGYRGMMAIHPAQVDVINAAFTPSVEEIAEAREIIELFAANPGAGTIGWRKGMLDRPHLSRAQQLLAQLDQ